MAKKLTIAEQFNAMIAKYAEVMTESELAFLKDRADKANAKNANRKPTKAQTENAEIKARMLAAMEDGVQYTVGVVQKAVGLESNQKTSALMRQLKDEGLVEREVIKGRAYFKKVAD